MFDEGVRELRPDSLERFAALGLAPGGEEHPSAVARELTGGLEAEAAVGAGH